MKAAKKQPSEHSALTATTQTLIAQSRPTKLCNKMLKLSLEASPTPVILFPINIQLKTVQTPWWNCYRKKTMINANSLCINLPPENVQALQEKFLVEKTGISLLVLLRKQFWKASVILLVLQLNLLSTAQSRIQNFQSGGMSIFKTRSSYATEKSFFDVNPLRNSLILESPRLTNGLKSI